MLVRVQTDDLSAAGSSATALARRHRTGSTARSRRGHRPRRHAAWTSRSAWRGPACRGSARPRQRPVSCTRPPGSGTRSAAQSHAINPATFGGHPAILAGVEEVKIVVAHHERATLRVGDVFLKIDADQRNTDVEVEAMAMAPVPTPEILWRKPPALALAALPGTALGHLGEPSTESSAAWAAAGTTGRTLHPAPLPPWPGRTVDEFASQLDSECEWLVANDVLPTEVVTRNRRLA